jgi:hypothetical protein
VSEPPEPRSTRSIEIPEEIAKGLELRIEGSSFRTVDAFIGFVLARLLDEAGASEIPFSEEEERRLRERLRSLGYID